MKVLMFGWEFPPHISGGLGTGREKPGNGRKVSPGCPGICRICGRPGDHQGTDAAL